MRGWIWGVAGALLATGLMAYGEELTLSTYYPSPRGVYEELRTDRLVLQDHATGRDVSLAMKDGKLLVTDLKSRKAFILIELPEEEEKGR